MLKFKIFLAVILLAYSLNANAATYYVDNSGSPVCSDTLSYGSESQPWCTISYALSQISGGDDLYVKAGTYNETFTISSSLSGSVTDRTVIQVYSDNTVTIQGSGVNTGRVKIDGADYVTFDGFKVTNMNQGIFVEGGAHNVIIQNCEIYSVGQEGIHIKENSYDIVIQNNIIRDTRQWAYNGEGIYIGTGSAGPSDNTHNVTVRNNTIYNTEDESVELKPGTYNCIVENNTIYNGTPGNKVGAIEVNQHTGGVQVAPQEPQHIIRNNTIHDITGDGIRAGTSSMIYNNIIYDISEYGIYVNNSSSDSWTRTIYHNTIDMSSSNAVYESAGTSDVRNNVGPSTPGNMATNSSYFVSTTEGSENYHLVDGAAPINSGADLRATVTSDIDGDTRDNSPDIGADEYCGTCADTTPPSIPTNLQVVVLSTK